MCFMGHIKADYQEFVFSEMTSNASTGKISGTRRIISMKNDYSTNSVYEREG